MMPCRRAQPSSTARGTTPLDKRKELVTSTCLRTYVGCSSALPNRVERNALLITPSCLPRYGATQTTRGASNAHFSPVRNERPHQNIVQNTMEAKPRGD